jgi:hypothetical protein
VNVRLGPGLILARAALGLAALAAGCGSSPAKTRDGGAQPDLRDLDGAGDIALEPTAPDDATPAPADLGTPDAADADAGGDAADAGVAEAGADALGISIAADGGQIVHNVNGHSMGLDTRAPIHVGKLVVVLGVDAGGYVSYLGKRGFHVMGVSSFHCPYVQDWSHGTFYPGDCRANSFDGLQHGDQANVDVEHSISGQVDAALIALAVGFPGEGWRHFLDDNDDVRWSDVIVMGVDYGATTAARVGSLVRLDRVIAETAIRDNSCGTVFSLPAWPGDAGTSPSAYYDASCTKYGAWLDVPPATPGDRFFVFDGHSDGIFADGLFAADKLHVVGAPVNVDVASPPFDGTHDFTHEEGHFAVVEAGNKTPGVAAAIDIAFAIPPENQHPAF